MGTKLMINACDLGWMPIKFGGKGAICHCKRGNCKWKKFTASKFGCEPDIEFISNQAIGFTKFIFHSISGVLAESDLFHRRKPWKDSNANVDEILSLVADGSLDAAGDIIASIFGGDGPRLVADHQSFIVEQAAEKAQAKKDRFDMLGLDMHGIGKGS